MKDCCLQMDHAINKIILVVRSCLLTYFGKARLAYYILLRLSAGSLIIQRASLSQATYSIGTVHEVCWTVLSRLLIDMSGLVCFLKHPYISALLAIQRPALRSMFLDHSAAVGRIL